MSKLEQSARQLKELLIRPVDTIAEMYCYGMGDIDDAVAALREALAEQAEQEPVCKRCNGTKIVPDGKMYSVDGFQLEVPIECVKDCPDCTAPVRTKDLTDDEIDVLWDLCGDLTLKYKFARAVIAAYKEKNK